MRLPRKLIPLLAAACWLAGCGNSPEPAADRDAPTPAQLQARIDQLHSSVELAEALRAIKRLQWAYGHYSEFGLWHDFADLFADTGIGHYTQGDLDRDGIRTLFLEQVGQGRLGLASGRIYPHISFSPVLTRADDGRHVLGRFRILAMLGGYGGNALWFHGVYENAYVQERGVWKIDEVSNAAQITGTFAAGLASQVGGEAAIAMHYSAAEPGTFALPLRFPAGVSPAPAAASVAAAAPPQPRELVAALAALELRLERLEDEAAVVNLQHQAGYYLDRRDWDALVALFTEQARFEPGLRGVYLGKASIRRALEQFGANAPAAGEVDDHILFQTYVSVAPDGRSARARVDELGLQGTPGVRAQWTQGIYENAFEKENGVWRIAALHYYPRLITDYARGWGADAQAAPGPRADYPPDAQPSEQYRVYPEFHIPAFHFAHPVTARPPQYPDGDAAAGRIGFDAVGRTERSAGRELAPYALPVQLIAAEARVGRALAYDAVENLIDAYAYYLDDCMTQEAATLFADDATITIEAEETARGAAGIASALQSAYCPAGRGEGELTLHHVIQPVITVADDGRTAHFRARLWEVHASNDAEDFYRGGHLEGEARRDDGSFKLIALTTDIGWSAPASAGARTEP